MARVLLFAFLIGVSVYALLDWAMNSKKSTPGGLSRWLWLAVIIFLPALGPLTWIVLRLVGQAESRRDAAPPSRRPSPAAPDDDPQFLKDWSKRIERRQRRSRPADPPVPPSAAHPPETDAERPPAEAEDGNTDAKENTDEAEEED